MQSTKLDDSHTKPALLSNDSIIYPFSVKSDGGFMETEQTNKKPQKLNLTFVQNSHEVICE